MNKTDLNYIMIKKFTDSLADLKIVLEEIEKTKIQKN